MAQSPDHHLRGQLDLPPVPVTTLGDGERLACLRLIRSENVGPVAFRTLVNHYGGAEAALEALPDLARRGGRRRPSRICPPDRARRELDAATAIGATPIFTIEPGYPAVLAALDHPPPLLYIKGQSGLLNDQPTIAIVGSRLCSAAGAAFTRTISGELGRAGFVVVSGLARGIDAAAHDASLPTGTIAVLAGGLDNVYPPEHRQLYDRISEAGTLVSERPPGFQPRGKDFPRRNRIISGMAYGVLVVEAARRSGSLTTARFAGEQGREVFAVPGHPLDPRAEGTNQLIKSGARIVTTAEDIAADLAPMLRDWIPPSAIAVRLADRRPHDTNRRPISTKATAIGSAAPSAPPPSRSTISAGRRRCRRGTCARRCSSFRWPAGSSITASIWSPLRNQPAVTCSKARTHG